MIVVVFEVEDWWWEVDEKEKERRLRKMGIESSIESA